MKRKLKMRRKMESSSTKVTASQVNPMPKVIVVVVVLALLIGVSLYYNYSSVGQAYKVEPKGMAFEGKIPDEEANLDKSGAVHFVVDKTNLTAAVTPSLSNTAWRILFVGASYVDSGAVQYEVRVNEEKGEVLAQGLLDDTEGSSGDLFLDDDDVPDLEVVYKNGILKVYNLNYVTAGAAQVEVYDDVEAIGNINSQKVGSLFFVTKVAKDAPKNYFYFKVSTSSMPAVTAFWKSGEKIEFIDLPEKISASDVGMKFRVMKLLVDPADEKPQVLVMNITSDALMVQREFVFAVNGRMYDMAEKNYPKVQIIKVSETAIDVNFTFNGGLGLYGFSLPCGSIADITTFPGLKENVNTIYTYEGAKVKQWKADAPANDLSGLMFGRGYLLKLQKDKSFSFTAKGCFVKDGQLDSVLPSLSSGWNFVGIKGNMARLASELKAPSGKKVVEIYTRSLEGDVKNPSVLEPGRAYWVKVE